MLEKFLIEGPTPLQGTIRVSGSKNAALPLMAAAILADGESILYNIPRLKDIYTFTEVIRATGVEIDYDESANSMKIRPDSMHTAIAEYELVRKMRASFYMLGAFLGRTGSAKVSLPGGCAWGPRPVDLHIKTMEALGANIELENGYVLAETPYGQLQGGAMHLEPSSVGATVNFLLAAVKAKGKSVLTNAAMEPDVVQLAEYLNQMGADIKGHGTSKIIVNGVNELTPCSFTNAPDRIEAGTFILLGAMHPEADLEVTNLNLDELGTFPDAFMQTGCKLEVIDPTRIRVKGTDTLKPQSVITNIYPGFPTDLQAQWATVMTRANGPSKITENIYKDRFSYVPEMNRLGANMRVDGQSAYIAGNAKMKAATVMSTDLRASVSLVMAGMMAEGKTEVLRIYHLDRGYEDLEIKLNKLGAKIKRVAQNV